MLNCLEIGSKKVLLDSQFVDTIYFQLYRKMRNLVIQNSHMAMVIRLICRFSVMHFDPRLVLITAK